MLDINEFTDQLSEHELKKVKEISDFVEDIEDGKRDLPKSCSECPAKSVELLQVVCDTCLLNTDMYVGDMFFASHGKRPKWCPLNKYRGEANGKDGQQKHRRTV